MKRALRIVRGLLIGLACLALLAAAGVYLFARRAWPRSSGTLQLAGLHGEVEITRDPFGVPHIFASDEHDLFFGQGFVHAQDRLWQMQLGRALAKGELSAMFGDAAVESDRLTRTFGAVPAARLALAALDPDTRAILEAYCEGVNAFLDGEGKALPIEFTILGVKPGHWEPLDVMLVGENIAMAMSLNAGYELMRSRLQAKLGTERAAELIPPYPADGPITLAPLQHAALQGRGATPASALQGVISTLHGKPGGSNGWVVHGSRTATGKPILANDTHLGLLLPSIWYENELRGGRYAVTGFSFPGAPLVASGHNEKIAWGITNMCSDVEDLYLEHVKDGMYEYQGKQLPLEVRTEDVPIKGAQPMSIQIFATRHGPLVNEAFSSFGAKSLPPLSMRWAAHEGGSLFAALAALDRAQSWSEFHEALRTWTSPSLNFLYADTAGNIGYQSTGRIPIRPAGQSGDVPVPGWTGDAEWQGFIPYDELPSVTNPAAGFLVSANNKVASDEYPHHLTDDWGDPYRAERITEQLSGNAHVSMADTRALQGDSYSLPAKALVPYLLALKPTDPLEQQAQEMVKGWDLRFERESAAATIYYLWYANLIDEIIGDELGPELLTDFRSMAMTQTPLFARWMQNGESPWFDDVRTPERETRDQISARAFTKGIQYLREKYGADPSAWRWGRLHTMTFVHAPLGQSGIGPLEWLFNSKTVQARGEPYSVNATFHDPGTSFAVSSGPSQRFVADLSALGESVSSTPIGQSGLLFHPHREDQVSMWARVEHHPMWFGRDALAKVSQKSQQVLKLEPATAAANQTRNP